MWNSFLSELAKASANQRAGHREKTVVFEEEENNRTDRPCFTKSSFLLLVFVEALFFHSESLCACELVSFGDKRTSGGPR